MLFNSPQFFVFFVGVFCLYLLLPHRWQNRFLILASGIFYSFWNWKFLFLLLISVSTDYLCSRMIFASPDQKQKRCFLVVAVGTNLAILGFFKYFNFFVQSASLILQQIFPGWAAGSFLQVVLPLGISFYTFEAISYVVDVYRGRTLPAKSYFDYLLFILYFPHLVAGPIMRARDFLPQIANPRVLRLDQFYEGSFLVFWGLFEKLFVADNLAKIVDGVFGAPTYTGAQVWVALYAFSFQIFCDFDGYSNMARGLGKCMGFELTINFQLPYFATNPRDFWQRWHISLSSWLRDYVYIPLGGNRQSEGKIYRALLVTMLLGGLWHGAAWTFVLWGLYHACWLILYRWGAPFWAKFPSGPDLKGQCVFWGKILLTFHLVAIGWLIFRAQSVTQILAMGQALFSVSFSLESLEMFREIAFYIAPVLLVQITQFYKKDLLAVFRGSTILKAIFYFVCFYLMVFFGVEGGHEFIYFQF